MGTATSKKRLSISKKRTQEAGQGHEVDAAAVQANRGTEAATTAVAMDSDAPPPASKSVEAPTAAALKAPEAVNHPDRVVIEETVEVSETITEGTATTEMAEQLKNKKRERIKEPFPLGAQRVFVQFDKDNPYAVTDFGALLLTTPEGHVLYGIEGLAYEVGLREEDVILSINNIASSMVTSEQQAILDALADIGRKISLIIKRRCQHGTKYWQFIFEVDAKDNVPFINLLAREYLGEDELIFPILGLVFPPDISFPVCEVFTYKYDPEYSGDARITLVSNDQFMEINNTQANFINPTFILKQNVYERVTPIPGAPTPIAIAADRVSNPGCGCPGNEREASVIAIEEQTKLPDGDCCGDIEQNCVSGAGERPLHVQILPSYMTGWAPIPCNSMFFFETENPSNTFVITQGDLYLGLSGDGQNLAVLTSTPTPLNVTKGDREVPGDTTMDTPTGPDPAVQLGENELKET